MAGVHPALVLRLLLWTTQPRKAEADRQWLVRRQRGSERGRR
jgi:hypothetical protein